MHATFLTLASLALCALPPAQEEGGATEEPRETRSSVSLDELVIEFYEPQVISFSELLGQAESLAGRTYHVEGRPPGELTPNMRQMYAGSKGLIQVIDTAESVDRVLEVLRRLDVSHHEHARGSAERETVEYRPRHVSPNVLQHVALAHEPRLALQVVQEQNLVVVRTSAEQAAALRALFARIDVPAPQVRFTVWVLQARPDASEEGVPPDLAEDLRALLPGTTFEAVGFALLQTTTRAGSHVSVRIEGADRDPAAEAYDLQLRPVAYDPENGALTVEDVGLVRHASGARQTVLHTSTVLRGGEYTVLGATGADPVLLVVRLAPVG